MMSRHEQNFIAVATLFTAKTGIECEYEKQYKNGSYVYFKTRNNGGMGMYIGVDGYKDAVNTLNMIMAGYDLAKTVGPDGGIADIVRNDIELANGYRLATDGMF